MKRLFTAAAVASAVLLGAGCGDWQHYHFTPDVTQRGGDPRNIQCGTVIFEHGDWNTSIAESVGRVCKQEQ